MTSDQATARATARAASSSLDHRVGPRGRFSLQQVSGEVTVTGVEGDRVRVRSADGRPLGDVFSVETGDDFVTLRQAQGFALGLGMFRRDESVDLEVEVPHGASVAIDTQSGDISARDLSGQKKFRTASGEVALTRLAGPVDVETVSGEIEIDGRSPIDLQAKSVSGDVEVRVPQLRRLELSTTSGDIRVDAELAGSGPFSMRSISGDAVIVGRSGFRVEAESITGDLSSDLPSKRESLPGRKVLIIGRPGPTLAFRSVSGDLHVAEPRDGGASLDERAGDVPFSTAAPAPVAGTADPVDSAGSGPVAAALPASAASSDAGTDEDQLEVLRKLERGEISVAEATERLSRLHEVPS